MKKFLLFVVFVFLLNFSNAFAKNSINELTIFDLEKKFPLHSNYYDVLNDLKNFSSESVKISESQYECDRKITVTQENDTEILFYIFAFERENDELVSIITTFEIISEGFSPDKVFDNIAAAYKINEKEKLALAKDEKNILGFTRRSGVKDNDKIYLLSQWNLSYGTYGGVVLEITDYQYWININENNNL